MAIPKAQFKSSQRIKLAEAPKTEYDNKLLFSFEAIEKNEYFDLDGTCQSWSKDLFDTMQKVSKVDIKDIYAGKYTGRNTTFRIHRHQNAVAPCKLPEKVSLEDMWQIRISKRKGGIHGVLRENVFYVIWFDPLHNLYPNKNYGGLRKVKPTSTCCKDRDEEIENLKKEIELKENDARFWENYAYEVEEKFKNKV